MRFDIYSNILVENYNWFGEIMQSLPSNLQNFKLNVFKNYQGNSVENLEWLG